MTHITQQLVAAIRAFRNDIRGLRESVEKNTEAVSKQRETESQQQTPSPITILKNPETVKTHKVADDTTPKWYHIATTLIQFSTLCAVVAAAIIYNGQLTQMRRATDFAGQQTNLFRQEMEGTYAAKIRIQIAYNPGDMGGLIVTMGNLGRTICPWASFTGDVIKKRNPEAKTGQPILHFDRKELQIDPPPLGPNESPFSNGRDIYLMSESEETTAFLNDFTARDTLVVTGILRFDDGFGRTYNSEICWAHLRLPNFRNKQGQVVGGSMQWESCRDYERMSKDYREWRKAQEELAPPQPK